MQLIDFCGIHDRNSQQKRPDKTELVAKIKGERLLQIYL